MAWERWPLAGVYFPGDHTPARGQRSQGVNSILILSVAS